MRNPKTLATLSMLALFYNLVVVLAVSLNFSWVQKLAAGGQFTNFPPALRIIYGVMSIVMIFLIYFVWDLGNGIITDSRQRTARILSIIFFISTLTQLISRSAAERWNAIPAIIVAYTFWVLSRTN